MLYRDNEEVFVGNLMANSASESNFLSDTIELSHTSSSVFSVPGFFVGFISKGLSDADSVRSPTSHLDLRGLSNFKNPFSFRSSRSLSDHEYKRKWDCAEVGLGILNSLYDETKTTGEVSYFPKGKSIIFRPQVKKTNIPMSSRHYYPSLVFSEKSNSLPTNYMLPSLSQSINYNSPMDSPSVVVGNIGSCSLDFTRPAPLSTGCSQNLNSNCKSFCIESKPTPVFTSGGSHVENGVFIQTQSLPISIDVSSLSVRDIELSEDYTCIISHGANPKTTHIFGDCVLECDTNNLSIFGKKEEQGNKSPQVDRRLGGLTSRPSDELLNGCYSCKTKLKEEEDIYYYRGDKLFCSYKCRYDNTLAEDEAGETSNKSTECSSESSSHEDLFLLGMHFAE